MLVFEIVSFEKVLKELESIQKTITVFKGV